MEHEKQGFVSRYIFSFDHKMIGKQYFTLAMSMGFIGRDPGGADPPPARLPVEALAVPREPVPRRHGQRDHGLPSFYVSLFTMHGTIMVFFLLSLLPVSGFGNFLIPLQIGARGHGVPVPEHAVLLDGGARGDHHHHLLLRGGGAAASGWTAYPPLSAIRSAIPGSDLGQTLWLVG